MVSRSNYHVVCGAGWPKVSWEYFKKHREGDGFSNFSANVLQITDHNFLPLTKLSGKRKEQSTQKCFLGRWPLQFIYYDFKLVVSNFYFWISVKSKQKSHFWAFTYLLLDLCMSAFVFVLFQKVLFCYWIISDGFVLLFFYFHYYFPFLSKEYHHLPSSGLYFHGL